MTSLPSRKPVPRERDVLNSPLAGEKIVNWMVVRDTPAFGYTKIAHTFNRLYRYRSICVSRSYVAYTLRQHRYEIAVLRRALKHKPPRAIPLHRTWAIDLTGKTDANGCLHMILGILDQGSRRALVLKALVHKSSWALLGYVCLAIARFGKPRTLKSDNEAIFKSRVFQGMLRLLGIRQAFSVVGCPWMNGRIERFFGTLKERLNLLRVDDRAQLKVLLDQFRFFYNEVRPHENLNGATPMEAWQGIDPDKKPPKAVTWVSLWGGLLSGFHIRR